MPEICTTATPCAGGGHRTLTIGGVTFTMHEGEILPLSPDEKLTLFKLAVRHKGIALAQYLNRVVIGEEATNVKVYRFFGPGAAIVKTNIGTAYVNICPGANGERTLVDLTGCTQFRLRLFANLIGVGQWGARVVRDADNVVLFEATNLGAAGERELDTDWQALPAAFLGVGLVQLRAQAKSTTASDDPSFRAMEIGLK